MQKGIEYKLTGESSRGSVAGYHRKPPFLEHHKGAKTCDIAGFKKAQRSNLIESFGDYRSKFTIGFEVEKNTLYRGALREYELFCGFETDGSCGYEAVTHILPLVPASTWRTKIFDMMHKAERIIDDRFSSSDRKRDGHYTCGGHITLGVDGLSGDDIRVAVRKNCGIVLALFRKRLSNNFCNHNRTMLSSYDANNHVGGYHHKYQVGLVKGDIFELRLPSKFESVKQMIRRYELMHELVDFSVNKPNGSHEAFLKTIRPIITSMYNGDTAKADEILELARHFRKFILNGEIHQDIARYV